VAGGALMAGDPAAGAPKRPPGSPRAAVRMAAVLFDPVPGNLVCLSQWCDAFRWSTASRGLDARGARHLRRVLALYPHEPLPDAAFHAPILPSFPPAARVEEDVVLGCHQGALFAPMTDLGCACSYLRIRAWLASCGTRFRGQVGYGDGQALSAPELARHCLEGYDELLAQGVPRPTYRHAHAARRARTARVVRGGDHGACRAVNLHHEQLRRAAAAEEGGGASPAPGPQQRQLAASGDDCEAARPLDGGDGDGRPLLLRIERGRVLVPSDWKIVFFAALALLTPWFFSLFERHDDDG